MHSLLSHLNKIYNQTNGNIYKFIYRVYKNTKFETISGKPILLTAFDKEQAWSIPSVNATVPSKREHSTDL